MTMIMQHAGLRAECMLTMVSSELYQCLAERCIRSCLDALDAIITGHAPSCVHRLPSRVGSRRYESVCRKSIRCFSDVYGSIKAFCARFSITITTTGILAMGTERKTRSGSQIPGIRNGFRYFLASSQSAQNGENE